MSAVTQPIDAILRPKALLTIHVVGTPKTKGSMKHLGHGHMTEQVKGSPEWRAQVAWAARKAYGSREPHTGPVKVDIVLEVPRPKRPKHPLPISRATGDSDKHARNIFDALVDARVIADDAQVVDHAVSKRYAAYAPGAYITVTEVQ